jgi:hypothetical protein
VTQGPANKPLARKELDTSEGAGRPAINHAKKTNDDPGQPDPFHHRTGHENSAH